jgi:hypothetical protein
MFRVSLLLLALFNLTGCLDLGGGGGGSSSGGGNNAGSRPPATEPPVVTPPVAPPVEPPVVEPPVTPPVTPPVEPPVVAPPPGETFPEPSAAVVDEINAQGFYDVGADGQPRPVRNDLTGDLAAMLQFVQSHSVDPQGNEAKNMPRLTSEREALLLVTPLPTERLPQQLRVQVTVDGDLKGELVLSEPDRLPKADRTGADSRPDVVYSRRAWSAVLPWDWVRPGMSLQVIDERGRRGERSAAAFDFAAPAELVVQSIRVGMLTEPPVSDAHWMLNRAAQAATEYFQTVPVARLLVSQYEDVKLDRVMIGSGVIYDTASAGEGGVYSGDMRENTAKSTFSTGINLANWGITSAGMVSQQQPQLTQTAVIHHAAGTYSNGRQTHGLSGGNGILTLYNAVGNEFSHEIGHHYGIGHYPGEKNGNYFLAVHHHDSGWGYIAYRKRMRGNLLWARNKSAAMSGTPLFADAYAFAPDAMSGGDFTSALSSYTHYTGYSTKNWIQPSLNNRAVWAADSPTGYRKWDADTRKMETIQPKVPSSNQVWYNSADGNYRKPRLFGVPVFTLLGGYDPVTNSGVLYPALRGNWGQVYELPAPNDAAASKQCWLKVDFVGGASQRIAVAPLRMGSNANKLHINLAQAERPLAATLQCREVPGDNPVDLASLAIAQGLPAMPAPVVVGREERFKALFNEERPKLQAALEAIANQPVLALTGEARLLYDSYAEQTDGLSATAQQVMQRLKSQEERALRLNRWLDAHGAQLASSDAARTALDALLVTLQFDQHPLLPAPQSFTMNNGNCVRAELKEGVWSPYVAAKVQCTGAADEQWLVDASGRIRSVAQPSKCLTATNDISLSDCDAQRDTQAWDFAALPQLKYAGRCVDLSQGFLTNGRGKLIMYGCTGGVNQKWFGLSLNDHALLPLLKSRNLVSFIDYAQRRDTVPSL